MATLIPRLLTPLVMLTLGSCSYAYDLKVVAIDGHVAFVVDPSSRGQPDCIRSIHVSADDGEPKATAAPGDDEALVRNGSVYWWEFMEIGSCQNPFPVIYGVPLKGKRSAAVGYVAAKRLKVGVVYEVGAESSGSGYGSGWFKIQRNGQIENYRNDPTPPMRDDNGYVINGSEAKP
ncbi:MAG: hypothetical protein JWN66_341 [Sphingomonas bacterium]|jgi:hypothetical protein|uniref:hypothetical protein n=1 Tax=Sphingomonas bacterium TaxID=1895847 RepID=UPI0026025A84|nr:hypothetical protein [Sphingomonas bacterium]MDB5703225.1 hypothetical protein [Sphingomonas bacterium]